MTIISADSLDPDFHVPVVVVGGGACGLTAGLAARDQGVDVVILERDATPMGNTSMSQGTMCAAGTRLQARYGIADDADRLARDVMAKVDGETDPDFAWKMAFDSGPTIDWLVERHGVPIDLDVGWMGYGHSVPRLHVMPNRTGVELIAALTSAVEAAGAHLVTSAEATALYADGESRVKGVQFRRPDGTIETVSCDALVIATCGFGANREMLRRYIPEMADVRYFGWEGATGDGIRWGMALGAGVADMSSAQNFGFLAEPQGIPINPNLLTEGAIQVNMEGERFSDEVGDVSGQGNRVARQPGGMAWLIFDERIHQAVNHLPEYREAVAFGALRRADSVAALCELTHLPLDPVERTLNEVVQAAAGTRPDPFGRVFTERSCFQAPFCAIKVTCALFHTQGGLLVDGGARVLRPDHSPLPNLFAGGGAARNLAGPGFSGYLPGAGLCLAVTLGRLAGSGAGRLVMGGAEASASAR